MWPQYHLKNTQQQADFVWLSNFTFANKYTNLDFDIKLELKYKIFATDSTYWHGHYKAGEWADRRIILLKMRGVTLLCLVGFILAASVRQCSKTDGFSQIPEKQLK